MTKYLLFLPITLIFLFSVQASDSAQEESTLAHLSGKSVQQTGTKIPLIDYMDKIQSQFGVFFNYNDKLIRNKSLSISNDEILTETNWEEIVAQNLRPLKLQLKKLDKNIYIIKSYATEKKENKAQNKEVGREISEKKGLSAQTHNDSSVNQFLIQGTVSDENGEALPGVNVLEKGTTNGTVTDIKGKFSFTLLSSDNFIVFSFIGYKSIEVQAAGRSVINVSLSEDISSLDEIVVIGYGTQKSASVTGAVEQIEVNRLTDQPNTSMATVIQGRLAGVLVNSPSGAPGGDNDTEIFIRGVGTLNDASPLILIDGMVSTMADFMTIDANDVATVSVLKDAASSAIYGNRAANGVLLVTTKRGNKEGKLGGSYNGFVGVQHAINLPDLMNSWEYLEWRNRGEEIAGRPALFTDDEIANYRDGVDPFQFSNYKPFDEFLKNSHMQTHNISFNGGSQNVRFATSLGYRFQEGIENFNEFEQYNFRTNLDASFLQDKLDIQLNIARISSENTYPPTSLKGTSLNRSSALGTAIKQSPTTTIRNPDGTYAHPNVALYNSGGWGSAIRDKYTTMGKLSYEVLKNLEVSVSYGLDKVVLKEKALVPTHTTIRNFFIAPTTETAISELYDGNAFTDYSNLGTFLSYKTMLARKHFIKILLGNTRENWKDQNLGIYGTDLISNDAPYINNLTSDLITRGGASEKGMISYFARVNYEYSGKYLVEFTMRADGSSIFRRENRWGMFPSVSAGWNLAEESFLQNNSQINRLKLRASYGILGNDKVARYVTYDQVARNQNYSLGGTAVSTAQISNVGNEDIKWETVAIQNLGLDATLFNSFDVSVDWFRKITSDILQEVPAPYIFGYEGDGITSNFAEMVNSGVEVVLNYQKQVGNFNFGIKTNASYLKNRVTKLSLQEAENNQDYIGFNDGLNIVREGDPFLALFGFEVGGIISSQEQQNELYNHFANGENPGRYGITGLETLGDWFYVDQNGDGRIDEEDKVILGSPLPKVQYGINLSMEWKGIDLSAFFQGSWGNKSFSSGLLVDPYFVGSAKVSRLLSDAWRPEKWVMESALQGQEHFSTKVENGEVYYLVDKGNLSSNIPVGGNKRANSAVGGNSVMAQNASYMRLKNLSLGYTLPPRLIGKSFLQNVRIYASVTNVFTLTEYLDFDPESALRGNDNTFNYPQTRTWNAGINISF